MMPLQVGPTTFDGLSEDELREGWRAYGEERMGYQRIPGTRPWGWWRFEAGEDRPRKVWIHPDPEVLRVAELGELTAEEYAAIAEKANEAKLRIGTGHERISDGTSVDVQAVETLEAVDEVRRGR